MTRNIVPGYVETLDPFTVRLGGTDDTAQPAERGGYATVGMRGMVDVSGGGRLWIGEYESDGVTAAVSESLSTLTGQVTAAQEVVNATSQSLTGFEERYTTDQAAAAIELGDIRDGLASALTADTFASLSPGDGLYLDPRFEDTDLSATRATNNALTYTPGGGMSGTGNLWLTARGLDEGATIPLTVGDLYTVRVWGTGLTSANGRVFAVKDDAGYASVATTYTTGGMATAFIVGSTNARVQVYRTGTSGTAAMTVTRVEVRHGIGGTLIQGGSITNDKISTGAVDARVVNVTNAFVDMKLTSPQIDTDTAAARGIKIVGNSLKAYDASGNLTVDIGGSAGTITGVTITGVNITGSSTITGATVRTATSGARVELGSITGGAALTAYRTGGSKAFSLLTDATGSSFQFYNSSSVFAGELWWAPSGDVKLTGGGISGGSQVALGVHTLIQSDAGWISMKLPFSEVDADEWRFRRALFGTDTKNALQFLGGSAKMPQTTTQPANLFMDSSGYIYVSTL